MSTKKKLSDSEKKVIANLEKENEKLKQRVAEIEADGNLPTERIAKRFQKLIDTMLATPQERLQNDLETLQEKDKNFAVIISHLSFLAKYDIEKYFFVKNKAKLLANRTHTKKREEFNPFKKN